MFKTPDYLLPKDLKQKIREICKKYNKIDDEFLKNIEKRHILFIEDGTDLKGEIASHGLVSPHEISAIMSSQ